MYHVNGGYVGFLRMASPSFATRESSAALTALDPMRSLVLRPPTPAIGRREVDAPRLTHRGAADVALDELIAHQREHAIAQEDRPRIAVPIDTRRLARIVAHIRIVRADLAELREAPVLAPHEQHRSR